MSTGSEATVAPGAAAARVDALLAAAAREHAADLHFEPTGEAVVVRARIDGRLLPLARIPRGEADEAMARLKVLAGVDVAEHVAPQDGRWTWEAGGCRLDIRLASAGAVDGETVTLRLLDQATPFRRLGDLGLHGPQLSPLRLFARAPQGLVLVSGPTGSGKTTTLYALLRESANGQRKLVTIEEPIEQHLSGVTQVEVNRAVGLDFATALRHFMRHDPDVLLVGEIRDRETARQAVQAALSGHGVLSTVHTRTAAGCVARLRELGVATDRLAAALRVVVAQRLVRQLCPRCRREEPPTPAEREVFAGFGFGPVPKTVRHPRGCDHCRAGYRGRRALFDVLTLTPTHREAITRGEPIHVAATSGAFREAALHAVARGQTSLEEVRPLLMEGTG